VLTVDPSIQWTSANGGTLGYTASEKTTTINGVSGLTGYDGSTYYFGKDLNGDGDKLDTVRLIAPSQTKTIRLGLIASLRYDINPDQTIRWPIRMTVAVTARRPNSALQHQRHGRHLSRSTIRSRT
jgi:iron complex outermembrane receptor protein